LHPDISEFLEPLVQKAADDRADDSLEMNLVDRDMAQFRFGPFKVVPCEKIITYLGQTSEYLHCLVLMQTSRFVCPYICGGLLIFIASNASQSNFTKPAFLLVDTVDTNWFYPF